MADMVLAVFPDQNTADQAVRDLEKSGFHANDISIIMRTTKDNYQGIKGGEVRRDPAGGTGRGMVEGAVIGGLAGLLYSVIALTFPGLGLVLFGGPIAATLGLAGAAATTATGAVIGGAAGGIIGLLSNLGLSNEDSRFYESRIRDGGIVLAVPVNSNTVEDAQDILIRNGADHIRTVNTDR